MKRWLLHKNRASCPNFVIAERIGMTYKELLYLGEKVLGEADIAEAKNDAWLLLEMLCKIDRNFYYLHMEEAADPVQIREYQQLLKKGRSGFHCSILWERLSLWDCAFVSTPMY